MAAPCYHWKTACVCVFNRSSLGTECVGYETKASNETRRMAHAARGCPTRSVPACLRPRDWHADRAVHPRPFGHYRRSRDPSPAPMSLAVPADDVPLQSDEFRTCDSLLFAPRCVGQILHKYPKAWVAFGCGSERTILFVPLQDFLAWLPRLNKTDLEERSYGT